MLLVRRRLGLGDDRMDEHVDVLIVGAGLSGIGAAHHLQRAFPSRKYLILESRDASGGTWDLFRYPGVRSDSDMQTLGYRFRPWTGAKALADGPSILRYVRDTAREAGIDEHIRYGYRVTSAAWSSADARWTVVATHTPPSPAAGPSPEANGANGTDGAEGTSGTGGAAGTEGAGPRAADTPAAAETVTFTCNFLFMCTG